MNGLEDKDYDILDEIFAQRSILDQTSKILPAHIEDIDVFLENYGISLDDPIETVELFGIYQEALNFIKTYFLYPDNDDGLRLELSKKFYEIKTIKDLFFMVHSGKVDDRVLACALLKVIHVIFHLDKDVRALHFIEIQRQILDRFYKIVARDAEGKLYLSLPQQQPLYIQDFETKPKKSRESMILKLLNKPDAVTEDIFDRLGLRFVTYSELDCFLVMKLLLSQQAIHVAHIKPTRSRNTLIPIEQLRNEQFLQKKKVPGDNPHTSEFYQALQITCRQLIKIKNPVTESIRELKKITQDHEQSQMILKKIDVRYLPTVIRFFYPYEVQIVDVKSHAENEKGKSSHAEYKKKQILNAMERLFLK